MRGITLSRLKQKESDQFFEVDVATDVNIAVIRVYIERFISGRRDWEILNIC